MNDQVIEQKLIEALSKYTELKLVILFGSFATGKQTEQSDIDIGVAAKTKLTADKKLEIIKAIAKVAQRPVDLVDLQQKQQPIMTQVMTSGKKLYCHDTALYAELIKTVICDAEDFLPLRSRILKDRRERWLNS